MSNIFLPAKNKFLPEIHLNHPGINTYEAYEGRKLCNVFLKTNLTFFSYDIAYGKKICHQEPLLIR